MNLDKYLPWALAYFLLLGIVGFAGPRLVGSSSGSGGAVTSIASMGSSPNAAGGTVSAGVLTLQLADATHPGSVGTDTQTFGGAKVFNGAVTAQGGLAVNNANLTVGLNSIVTGNETVGGTLGVSGTFTHNIASGSNAIAFTNSGARLDLGTGSTDYLVSDGTNVTTVGKFKPGTGVGSGSTSINVPEDTYISFGAGELEYVRGLSTGVLSLSNPVTASGLKMPVVHGTGTAEKALEAGSIALVAGTATVTFTTAFGAAPICTCADTAGSALACSMNSASTTQVVVFGTVTDTINYICIGNR